MINLVNGQNEVRILPECGGAVAYWRCDGKDILRPVSDPNLQDQKGVAVAGYPLIPYSNRIAQGHFNLSGRDVHLTPNMLGEPHSIHGNAWQHNWTVGKTADDYALLRFHHLPKSAHAFKEWPFPYEADLSFHLKERSLRIEIYVKNSAEVTQPIGMGFHPFFSREPGMLVSFAAQGLWTNDSSHLPDRILPCQGQWDFNAHQNIDARAIDHCFFGWTRQAVLKYPMARYELQITASDHFGHLVMFTAPEKEFVALEAVTNMTDAIHHLSNPDNGLAFLAPGETLSGWITYQLSDL